MAYLVHHDVLPETKYKEPLLKATAVARAAPRQLRDAKAFEDVVCSGKCLNRMCWCLWGGKYCGPERGGMERESRGSDSKVQPAGVDDANGLDDGGWTVENGTSRSSCAQQYSLVFSRGCQARSTRLGEL